MRLFYLIGIAVIGVLAAFKGQQHTSEGASAMPDYPLHEDITATVFWVGEEATEDNAFISNAPSCWDEQWVTHFGGVDDPENRNGYYPAGFTPKENPFYVALPYSDFGEHGRKANASKVIPWAREKKWESEESMCKNRWVRIQKDDKVVYAQWEDSGPFEYDDVKYVFGSARPKNQANRQAGIDVSPAVKQYLDLKDIDSVDWQFADDSDVPQGPWKEIVTTSQTSWE